MVNTRQVRFGLDQAGKDDSAGDREGLTMVPTFELAQNSCGTLKKADVWAHSQRH